MSIWYLFCSGVLAIIQVSFLIRFSRLVPRLHHYLLYAALFFFSCFLDSWLPVPRGILAKMHMLILGIGMVFVFSRKILKQDSVTSAILGILLITTNILTESMLVPLKNITGAFLPASEAVYTTATGILILAATWGILHFFSANYDITSGKGQHCFLILAMPMLFIDILMRAMMDLEYLQNYELLGLSVFAFLCVCGMLFAYEKILTAFEHAHQNELLLKELDLQKNYVAEAAARYEATRIFRHDFKNHLIALGGMIQNREIDKAADYLRRFGAISDYIAAPESTGNAVIDILLYEKLAHAKSAGIDVICDIVVSSSVRIDDFDLSVLFSNGIDNAIKACSHMKEGEKTLAVTARQHNEFFLLDITNSYEPGTVPCGTGLGLPSIQRVVKKYHGAVEVTAEQGMFRLCIILPFE